MEQVQVQCKIEIKCIVFWLGVATLVRLKSKKQKQKYVIYMPYSFTNVILQDGNINISSK